MVGVRWHDGGRDQDAAAVDARLSPPVPDAGPIKTSFIGSKMLSAAADRFTLPLDGIPTSDDVWRPSRYGLG